MTALLQLRGVGIAFGGLQALADVNLRVDAGEIIGVIGPNGAGKTTLVNVCCGVHRPASGRIELAGRRIDGLRDHAVARLGMARTFQIVQPFPAMSVLENVRAAALFGGGIRDLDEATAFAQAQLQFTGIAAEADKPASALPLPFRKRLELAKSLALKPRLIWLDEVNAGLNSDDLQATLALIRAISARGITILMIEHLMKVVLGVSSRIVALKGGRIIADGAPQAVLQDAAVVEAYLGSRHAAAAVREGA